MRMSYDRIGNWRVRKNGRKADIFQTVEEIKRRIKTILPEIESDRLIAMMSHCRNFYRGRLHYGRRNSPNMRPRELTPSERILYDFLLKYNLNPCTTYRWFIATRIPSDIKDKLSKGMISQRKAMEISANRRRVKESNHGLLMMEELRTAIGGL
jgi:hypothetical protein